MMLSLIVLALIALVVIVSVRAHRDGRRRFRLYQFRPAAPFSGILPSGGHDRDVERLVAELRAHGDAPADIHLRVR
ncbi:hypothetical protein [Pseudonocardia dioxanivorans]|uniref:hypothetical protein n=1 Tax=Pseudonocardia dioxanivorans TaxID=240495 RepID=UPI000CD11D58|nr:hypothetical protein [Pseudonocardia dioxanivorans]